MDKGETKTTIGNVVFGPDGSAKTAIGSPLSNLPTMASPQIVWGHAVCNRCLKSFDYIKQHRTPVPVMCNRSDP